MVGFPWRGRVTLMVGTLIGVGDGITVGVATTVGDGLGDGNRLGVGVVISWVTVGVIETGLPRRSSCWPDQKAKAIRPKATIAKITMRMMTAGFGLEEEPEISAIV